METEEYKKKTQEIGPDATLIVPTQLSFLVNIPGQEVGIHFDTPWFIGADRLSLPLWLLQCMENSGLYTNISLA